MNNLEQIKLFYISESDSDEIKELQKTINKWLSKHQDSIEVIDRKVAFADEEVIISISYHATSNITL